MSIYDTATGSDTDTGITASQAANAFDQLLGGSADTEGEGAHDVDDDELPLDADEADEGDDGADDQADDDADRDAEDEDPSARASEPDLITVKVDGVERQVTRDELIRTTRSKRPEGDGSSSRGDGESRRSGAAGRPRAFPASVGRR
jgi:hypothetical protein